MNGTYKGQDTIKYQEFGNYGALCIVDTDPHAAPDGYCFCALQALADTVYDSLTTTRDAAINTTDLEGLAIGEGTIIYGQFTDVELTSGSVLAYYGKL